MHHAQILSIFATLVVVSAVPLAVVALSIEVLAYVRVRLWLRLGSLGVGVLMAINAASGLKHVCAGQRPAPSTSSHRRSREHLSRPTGQLIRLGC